MENKILQLEKELQEIKFSRIVEKESTEDSLSQPFRLQNKCQKDLDCWLEEPEFECDTCGNCFLDPEQWVAVSHVEHWNLFKQKYVPKNCPYLYEIFQCREQSNDPLVECEMLVCPDCEPDYGNYEAACVSGFCTKVMKELDKSSAAKIMEENDCWWSLSEEGVSLGLEDSYWVMRIDRCLGECRVHTITRAFEKDENQMCMGALP